MTEVISSKSVKANPRLVYRKFLRLKDGRIIDPSVTPYPFDLAVTEAEPTEEEAAAFMAALGEAEEAATRALLQVKRNLSHLRDARLEIETARDIAAASNQMAVVLAGASE